MKLTILYESDPVLRTKAEPVDTITAKTRKLVDEMFETMYGAKGIGLAAPQVGESKRVIVLDLKRRGCKRIALINPVIVLSEGLQSNEEGCLSCPGVWAQVIRAASVKVAGLDPAGNVAEVEAEQMFAAALQHEIDHLDGILFIDRISATERIKIERQRQEVLQM